MNYCFFEGLRTGRLLSFFCDFFIGTPVTSLIRLRYSAVALERGAYSIMEMPCAGASARETFVLILELVSLCQAVRLSFRQAPQLLLSAQVGDYIY